MPEPIPQGMQADSEGPMGHFPSTPLHVRVPSALTRPHHYHFESPENLSGGDSITPAYALETLLLAVAL